MTILQQIVLTPLFLYAWGAESYGEWLTLTALLSYMTLADAGVQQFAINRLTQAWAVGNLTLYHTIYHSALTMYIFLGLGLSVLGTGLSWLVSFHHVLFTFKTHTPFVTFIVLTFLTFEFSSSFLLGLFLGIFRTFQEYPRGVLFLNLKLFCLVLFSAIALLFKHDWILLVSIRVIVSTAIPLFAIRDIHKRHPDIIHGWHQTSKAEAWYLLRHGSWFMGITAAHAVSMQGSVLVIQTLLGPVAVASFSIIRTLVNVIYQFRTILYYTFVPEITAWDAKHQLANLQQAYRSLQKISLLIASFCAIVLFFEVPQILQWWVGDSIAYHANLVNAFLVLLVLQSSRMTSQTFATATNHPKPAALSLFASSVLGLMLGTWLILHVGVEGMVIGLLLGEMSVAGWYLPWWIRRRIQLSWMRMVRTVWISASVVIAGGWLAGWMMFSLQFNAVVEFFILPFAVAVIMAVGTFFILEKREQHVVASWFHNIRSLSLKHRKFLP